MQNTTFIHVHQALAAGLRRSIATDQAVAHGLEHKARNEGGGNCCGRKLVATALYGEIGENRRCDVQANGKDSSCHGSCSLLLCGGLGPVLLPVLGAQQLAANASRGLYLRAVLDRNALGALPVSDGGFLELEHRGELLLATRCFGCFFDGLLRVHGHKYRMARQ